MIIKELQIQNKTLKYNLTYKKVKNINLRIKPDGTVNVSASGRVPVEVIEAFLVSKGDFILSALEKYKNMPKEPVKQYFSEEELRETILNLCEKVYPYFEKRGIVNPKIKFRKMVSRWGSCHLVKGILTFNLNLVYAPFECVEYVVLHEFTHFLQANHSREFYNELEKICPDWKARRKMLRELTAQS